MADLTVSTITVTGITDPAVVNLTDTTNTFDNDGKTYLKCTFSAAATLTMTAQKDQPFNDASANTALTQSSGTHLWGPWPTVWFNNLAGKATFTIDTAANCDVAPISLLDDFN